VVCGQLQAVFRGVAARKRVLKLLTAGEDIQRYFLMVRQRERFRGMVTAAKIIQRGFRVSLVRGVHVCFPASS
jgi:hypothetical protein